MTQQQLPLAGGRKPGLDNFIADANQTALAAFRDWLAEPRADLCVLQGPSGSGKSHLLQAASARWRALGRPCHLVPLAQGLGVPERGSEAGGLLAVDDLDQLGSGQAISLMRAIDAAREGHWRVLLASATPVDELQLPFEDLRSRLQWGVRLPLRPLTEPGLTALMAQRASELGVQWSERNSEFLLRRLPRDADTMLRCVDDALRLAIRSGRKLGVPLLAELLTQAQFSAAVQQAAAEPEGAGHQ